MSFRFRRRLLSRWCNRVITAAIIVVTGISWKQNATSANKAICASFAVRRRSVHPSLPIASTHLHNSTKYIIIIIYSCDDIVILYTLSVRTRHFSRLSLAQYPSSARTNRINRAQNVRTPRTIIVISRKEHYCTTAGRRISYGGSMRNVRCVSFRKVAQHDIRHR